MCYGHNNLSEGFGEIHPRSHSSVSAHAQNGLKTSTYRRIKTISKNCYDPSRASWAMREYLKSQTRSTKTVLQRNLYNNLIRKNIGTNEAESLADSVESRDKNKPAEVTMVKILMKIRRRTIEKEVKICRRQCRERFKELKKHLIGQDQQQTSRIKGEFKRIQDETLQEIWKMTKEKHKAKGTHLKS